MKRRARFKAGEGGEQVLAPDQIDDPGARHARLTAGATA